MVLNHRDSLYYEKDKCLRLLGVDHDHKSVQLDDVISQMTGLSVNADMSVENKDSVINKLKRRIETLDRETEEQRQQIEDYRSTIADKEREIAEMRRKIHIS